GAIRNAMAKENPGIRTCQTNVEQAALGQAIGREQLILALDLDAEEIGSWHGLGGAQEEQPFAETHFHLNGMIVSEDAPPIQRRIKVNEVGFQFCNWKTSRPPHVHPPVGRTMGMPMMSA